MKKIFFLILLLFSFFINAQAVKDTTLLKITNYKKQDSIRVEMLIDYCVNNTFSVSDKMLVYAKEAFQISTKIKYTTGEIRSLNCIGNYYSQQAIYDKAIYYYTKALSKAEKKHDIKNIIIGKSNIAIIHTRLNQTEKALKLLLESDELLVKNFGSVSSKRAAILTNIGNNYSSMGLHNQSIQSYLKVLSICQKANIPFGIAISQSNLGSEYIQLKQYKKAFQYLIPAMEISKKNGLNNFLGQVYKDIGLAYIAQNQTKLAIVYLNKSMEICKKINDQNTLLKANEALHKLYAQTKDYKNAYTTSLNFIIVKDSVYGFEKQKTIAEINTKYETEKKETQIKTLSLDKKIANLESQRQKTIAVVLGIFIVSLLIILYFLFNKYKIKKLNELLKIQLDEAEKTIEAEKKATESELKALKSQMNPHFIFNALSGIQDQFMYGDKVIANEQMGNFTYLTRQILTVSGKKQILIATEIEILTKYLELEKMRFYTDFEYQINTSGALDEDYHEIPPMLIQPFVENSIKHGLLHKSGLKKVNIHFELDSKEECIICTIEDNGIGRVKSEEIKARNENNHQSFSTESITQRLEIWNKNTQKSVIYSDLLNSNSEIIGTKVILIIEIH